VQLYRPRMTRQIGKAARRIVTSPDLSATTSSLALMSRHSERSGFRAKSVMRFVETGRQILDGIGQIALDYGVWHWLGEILRCFGSPSDIGKSHKRQAQPQQNRFRTAAQNGRYGSKFDEAQQPPGKLRLDEGRNVPKERDEAECRQGRQKTDDGPDGTCRQRQQRKAGDE